MMSLYRMLSGHARIFYYILIVLLGVASCSKNDDEKYKGPAYTSYIVKPSSKNSEFSVISLLHYFIRESDHDPSGIQYSARHIHISDALVGVASELDHNPFSPFAKDPKVPRTGKDIVVSITSLKQKNALNQTITFLSSNKAILVVWAGKKKKVITWSKGWKETQQDNSSTINTPKANTKKTNSKKVNTNKTNNPIPRHYKFSGDVSGGNVCGMFLLDEDASLTIRDYLLEILGKGVPSSKILNDDIIPKLSKAGIVALLWQIGIVKHTKEDINSEEYRLEAEMEIISNRWYRQFGLLMAPVTQSFGKPLPEGQLSFLFDFERANPREFFVNFQHQRFGGIFSHNMVIFAEGLRSPFPLGSWEGELTDHLDKFANAIALTLKEDMLHCHITGSVPMDFIVCDSGGDGSSGIRIKPGDPIFINDGDMLVIQGCYRDSQSLSFPRLQGLLLESPVEVVRSLFRDFFTSLKIQKIRRPQSVTGSSSSPYSSTLSAPSISSQSSSEDEPPIKEIQSQVGKIGDKIEENNQEIILNSNGLEQVPSSVVKDESSKSATPLIFSQSEHIFEISKDIAETSSNNDKIDGRKQEEKIMVQSSNNIISESVMDLTPSSKSLDSELIEAFRGLKVKSRRNNSTRSNVHQVGEKSVGKSSLETIQEN